MFRKPTPKFQWFRLLSSHKSRYVRGKYPDFKLKFDDNPLQTIGASSHLFKQEIILLGLSYLSRGFCFREELVEFQVSFNCGWYGYVCIVDRKP